jgi:ubiquinone/menaquinone biosynthesis C-methylase UbiE
METVTSNTPPVTSGILHNAAGYDALMWLLHFGRERAVRKDVLRLAGLARGDSVLDVGCGTGTLAIAAKERLGAAGSVLGIDASPEMIARARAKAKRRHLDIAFERAAAEALPFPNARFDVVLSTIMLHHLPRKIREQAAREIRRVLKPGGRAVILDFQDSGKRNRLMQHFRHRRHGHVKIDEMLAMLTETGLTIVQSGLFRKPNLYFVIATTHSA